MRLVHICWGGGFATPPTLGSWWPVLPCLSLLTAEGCFTWFQSRIVYHLLMCYPLRQPSKVLKLKTRFCWGEQSQVWRLVCLTAGLININLWVRTGLFLFAIVIALYNWKDSLRFFTSVLNRPLQFWRLSTNIMDRFAYPVMESVPASPCCYDWSHF